MGFIALFSGLIPNLLTTTLTPIFNPSVLGIAAQIQPLMALILARLLGLQYFPTWTVWLGIFLIIPGQLCAKEQISKSFTSEIQVDADLSIDSANLLQGRPQTDTALVLV